MIVFWIINGVAWALNGWLWFQFSRAIEYRLDAQVGRLARLELTVGVMPAGYPLDKMCPRCGAEVGYGCSDNRGFPHKERF